MFKKGDRVIYTGGGTTYERTRIGKRGTITADPKSHILGEPRTYVGIVFDDQVGESMVYTDNIRHSKQTTLKWIKENL